MNFIAIKNVGWEFRVYVFGFVLFGIRKFAKRQGLEWAIGYADDRECMRLGREPFDDRVLGRTQAQQPQLPSE